LGGLALHADLHQLRFFFRVMLAKMQAHAALSFMKRNHGSPSFLIVETASQSRWNPAIHTKHSATSMPWGRRGEGEKGRRGDKETRRQERKDEGGRRKDEKAAGNWQLATIHYSPARVRRSRTYHPLPTGNWQLFPPYPLNILS